MASIISAGTTSGTALNMAGDTSGVLQLATNGSTTALTIDTSQRVGIGTASPAAALDVAGTATVSSQANVAAIIGPHSVSDLLLGSLNGNSPFIASQGAYNLSMYTNATERVRIDSNGNVGIGGSPSVKFEVVDGAASSNATMKIYNPTNTNTNFGAALQFGTASSTNYLGEISALRTNSAANFSAYLKFSYANNGVLTEGMRLDSAGALILVGSTAQKASGTTWSNPSDQRLKDNIRDYTKGTTELMQVRVREWEYNGKGGTTEGLKGLGVVADEVMTVLPNTVETYDTKLNADDEETTAIKKFDATEITWLLVKTVQEQQTIINDLKARITALEGAA
jgi:hypothetical protein